MSIAKNISRLRSSANMTQRDFAKIAEVEPATVSQWEHGVSTPRMKSVDLLAKHFGVTRSDIVDELKYEPGIITKLIRPSETASVVLRLGTVHATRI